MVDHPSRARLAEIIVGRTATEQIRGSGYLVAPGWVLTAGHVVQGATSIGVWLGASAQMRAAAGVGVDPGRVLLILDADLALVPVGGLGGGPSRDLALFGRLDRDAPTPVPVVAAGFP